jgi:hypothetical protein
MNIDRARDENGEGPRGAATKAAREKELGHRNDYQRRKSHSDRKFQNEANFVREHCRSPSRPGTQGLAL